MAFALSISLYNIESLHNSCICHQSFSCRRQPKREKNGLTDDQKLKLM
ncbi:hypothetical protein [Okeania sp. SIO2B3]|nr:hypothetical protein [Okeania sp. SIO2B3]NET43054.1 hypothetical protein [Okeania sp. SIO2B3]